MLLDRRWFGLLAAGILSTAIVADLKTTITNVKLASFVRRHLQAIVDYCSRCFPFFLAYADEVGFVGKRALDTLLATFVELVRRCRLYHLLDRRLRVDEITNTATDYTAKDGKLPFGTSIR